MALGYKNITGPSPRSNNVGGLTQRLYVAPQDYFDTIAAVTDLNDSTATDAQQFAEISADHTFLTGKGFHRFYGTRDMGDIKLVSVGDRDGRGNKGTGTWTIPGVSLDQFALANQGKNDRWIVLEELADGTIVQLGSDRFPAEIKFEFDSAKNESGLRQLKLTIESFLPQLQIYTGAITHSTT